MIGEFLMNARRPKHTCPPLRQNEDEKNKVPVDCYVVRARIELSCIRVLFISSGIRIE